MVAAVSIRSGRIDPENPPQGRFLYRIEGQPIHLVREGEALGSHKAGGDWFMKLAPGLEWVRASFVFVLAGLPPADELPDLAPKKLKRGDTPKDPAEQTSPPAPPATSRRK